MPSPQSDSALRLLEYFEDPYHRGRCEHVTHYGEARNEICGDVVVVELQMDEDRVSDAWFDGEGCLTSQAVASMLVERVEGRQRLELKKLTLNSMLADLTLQHISIDQLECCRVALYALNAALDTPLDATDAGPTFGGPDLGDEC